LNPNNLAGYLNLGALAGLGLILTKKPILPTWLVGVGVMLIVGVDVTGATRDTWTELLQKDLSKIAMLVWAKPLLRDHPWFGVGRGAFESVFPVYRFSPGNLV